MSLCVTGIAAAETAYQFCTPDTVQSDGLCHFDATNLVFPSDITVKIPANYADQRAVEDYLNRTVDDYENDVRSLQPTPDGSSFTASGAFYESPRAGMQSDVLRITENVSGTAHPTTFYKSFTVDVASRQPIGLDQLFTPGTRPAEVLYPLVAKQLASPSRFGADFAIPAGIGLDEATYQNFAVTDDAIHLFFGQYDLGARAEPVEVILTKGALAGHLAPGVG
ncbi:RsiV family protein [Mycolicibacterium sp. 050158]|uniref:RsiV family protein n=1 Tax=Mycolicibacterium sp. 050158 TaxID=3090602 RepID=UPI00299E1EA2|nr:RsiV family protein [Mycolicibacterium sp. 050158]MDX1889307.1 RsiV family protein [Mycolicibacterium sp. 050158]